MPKGGCKSCKGKKDPVLTAAQTMSVLCCQSWQQNVFWGVFLSAMRVTSPEWGVLSSL